MPVLISANQCNTKLGFTRWKISCTLVNYSWDLITSLLLLPSTPEVNYLLLLQVSVMTRQRLKNLSLRKLTSIPKKKQQEIKLKADVWTRATTSLLQTPAKCWHLSQQISTMVLQVFKGFRCKTICAWIIKHFAHHSSFWLSTKPRALEKSLTESLDYLHKRTQRTNLFTSCGRWSSMAWLTLSSASVWPTPQWKTTHTLFSAATTLPRSLAEQVVWKHSRTSLIKCRLGLCLDKL